MGWVGWDLCAGLFYEHRFAMLIITADQTHFSFVLLLIQAKLSNRVFNLKNYFQYSSLNFTFANILICHIWDMLRQIFEPLSRIGCFAFISANSLASVYTSAMILLWIQMEISFPRKTKEKISFPRKIKETNIFTKKDKRNTLNQPWEMPSFTVPMNLLVPTDGSQNIYKLAQLFIFKTRVVHI